MTAEPSHIPDGVSRGPQQLVLVGAGQAHLQVLAQWAARPLAQIQVVLVAPQASLLVPSMLPGFMAGHYALEDCSIAVEPLVQRGGIRWVDRNVVAVDMVQQVLQLDDGSALAFDWLSINASPVQDRGALERHMPGAREHGLFLRPIESFAALWPRVVALGEERALRVAVIGTGADGVELALAARHRLPNAAVTLVCGDEPLAARYGPTVQQRLVRLLKKRKVTVLQDRALSLKAASVQLACGADLACDVPLLALGMQAPSWLAGSGLALDAQGFPAVDMYQRSTSHSRVFAVHDADRPFDNYAIAHSATTAADAGATLAHNLAAATAGTALKPHRLAATTVNLLSCGARYAVGSWRSLSAQGRWLWWLKNWRDRRLVARFTKPATQ